MTNTPHRTGGDAATHTPGGRPVSGQYRKRPVVVEAMEFTQSTYHEIERWSGGKVRSSPVLEPTPDSPTGLYLQIETLEGVMTAIPGDWIIRGIKGEFYPCKPDIFAATYEPVPPTPPCGTGEDAAVEADAALVDVAQGIKALYDERQAIFLALNPECPAFPGVPNTCNESVCDCFAADDLAGQITTLRARLAAVEGEGENSAKEAYDRGFNAGLTATIQLRDAASERRGAEAQLALHSDWMRNNGYTEAADMLRLATLFPEAPDA